MPRRFPLAYTTRSRSPNFCFNVYLACLQSRDTTNCSLSTLTRSIASHARTHARTHACTHSLFLSLGLLVLPHRNSCNAQLRYRLIFVTPTRRRAQGQVSADRNFPGDRISEVPTHFRSERLFFHREQRGGQGPIILGPDWKHRKGSKNFLLARCSDRASTRLRKARQTTSTSDPPISRNPSHARVSSSSSLNFFTSLGKNV